MASTESNEQDETGELIYVDSVNKYINTTRESLKDMFSSTIEKLHATIEFLKSELEEKNLLVRTLLLRNANEGSFRIDDRLVDGNLEGTETTSSVTETTVNIVNSEVSDYSHIISLNDDNFQNINSNNNNNNNNNNTIHSVHSSPQFIPVNDFEELLNVNTPISIMNSTRQWRSQPILLGGHSFK